MIEPTREQEAAVERLALMYGGVYAAPMTGPVLEVKVPRNATTPPHYIRKTIAPNGEVDDHPDQSPSKLRRLKERRR